MSVNAELLLLGVEQRYIDLPSTGMLTNGARPPKLVSALLSMADTYIVLN